MKRNNLRTTPTTQATLPGISPRVLYIAMVFIFFGTVACALPLFTAEEPHTVAQHAGGLVALGDWDTMCSLLHPDLLTEHGINPTNCTGEQLRGNSYFAQFEEYIAYLQSNWGYTPPPEGSYEDPENLPEPPPFFDGGQTGEGHQQLNFESPEGPRGGYCVDTAQNATGQWLIRELYYGSCYEGYADCDDDAVNVCVGVTPTPDVEQSGALIGWPVGGVVTAEYGCYGIDNGWPDPSCPDEAPFWHNGIDIANGVGTPLLNVIPGTSAIEFRGDAGGCNSGGYGQYVQVRADTGEYQTIYAHMSAFYVEQGDPIGPWDGVGEIGLTGCTTGPHLHFVTRHWGIDQNPRSMIPWPGP